MAAEEEKTESIANPKKPKKKLKKIKLEIIEESGNKLFAKSGDTVIIRYISKFYGGDNHKKLIDSGDDKSFKLGTGQVIQGWEECLLANKISLGSTAKIKMPHNLCYGYPVDIPFEQDMLFEIELLQINDKKRIIKPFEEFEIEVLKEGDSKTFPAKNDYVQMHYEGFFHGGSKHKQKFDSSIDRNKVFGFKIGKKQVIKGWDEGVMKLSKGTKAILRIPSKLGYGDKGSPDKTIPKGQDLLFRVELLNIKPHKK